MFSKNLFLSFLLATALSVFVVHVKSGSVDVNDGLWVAQWAVDTLEGEDHIFVDITAKTTGYVGFGISAVSNMTGADLYICGYSAENSTKYGWDMHGIGNIPPVFDEVNNYDIISASENETHTTVRFSRALKTSDETEDIEITNSVQFVLWSIGEIDALYHHPARGVLELNLFD